MNERTMNLRQIRLRICALVAILAPGGVFAATGAACGNNDNPAMGVLGDAGPGDARSITQLPACVPQRLATDKNNCGRCGHDCFNGECKAGVCLPLILASG